MARSSLRQRLSPNALAARAGEVLPTLALKPLLAQALRGFGVSLCLHRVATVDRVTDWQPGLNISPTTLDTLVELLLSASPASGARWLTLSFDDGYSDAADYIATRAPLFPTIDFTFFVCPEKLEKRAGFRWDAAELAMRNGIAPDTAKALLDAPVDAATENARPDLTALADAPEYALATLEQVKALAALANVRIGNHTNLHLNAVTLSDEQARAEYRSSTQTFLRLLGPQREFAFPYGTPRHQFAGRHVEMLRELGPFEIWSTEPRPYRLEERKPGAVLPRFPVNGRHSAKAIAGWVLGRALNHRLRGSKYAF